LSMMVQKLEDELGVKIFDRARQPVMPTAAGLMVIEQARRILHEVARLQDQLRRQKESLSGELRVGIIPTLAPYLVHRFLNRFLEKYPSIHLSVAELTTASLTKRLRKNQLDVGLLVGPLHDPSIREEPLFYEPLLVYSFHAYPKAYLLPEDINPDELLLLEEGHCLRSQIMNLCELRRQGDSRLHYQSGSLETLIRLVGLERGITILPALAVETLEPEQRQRVLPFQAPAPVREVVLATHRDFLKNDLIAALKAEVVEGVPEAYREHRNVRRISL
ncbi:MAG TPA: LysR substrate-binding domain-containing protein, partial [Saprospiraceae bacterium]|nr:LysR substrate-binding domain-containing protein [Saprospiraceae bacterium]